MRLLRLTGDAGVQIFDMAEWTKEEAIEDYRDNGGCEPEAQTHEIDFDAVTGDELRRFISRGEI